MSSNGASTKFEGFSSPNGTIVPDEVFDVLLPEFSDAELRVLLYIMRRTFGWKKDSNNISLKQMVGGSPRRTARFRIGELACPSPLPPKRSKG